MPELLANLTPTSPRSAHRTVRQGSLLSYVVHLIQWISHWRTLRVREGSVAWYFEITGIMLGVALTGAIGIVGCIALYDLGFILGHLL